VTRASRADEEFYVLWEYRDERLFLDQDWETYQESVLLPNLKPGDQKNWFLMHRPGMYHTVNLAPHQFPT